MPRTQARHTEYFCEVPAERLGEALARLLDMLARALLDKAAQLREREVVHAELISRGQDPDTLATAALAQALPDGHRCATFQAGNRDTLKVEEDDFQQALQTFHRRFYQAGQLSLLLVGPQPVDELFAMAQRHARVLRRLPELFASGDCPQLTPQRLRELYRRARFEGLGVAIEVAGQREIESLFAAVAPLSAGEPPAQAAAGRYWHDAGLDCDDSLLLLFCPQPAPDAPVGAVWRLLAQLFQQAFSAVCAASCNRATGYFAAFVRCGGGAASCSRCNRRRLRRQKSSRISKPF